MLLKRLRENGLKLTPQRLEIINILAVDKGHPGAPDIFQKAQKKIPQISISTVYYTLDLFKRHGLIKEIEFYEMPNRYEADTSDHLNLICAECGKIEDYLDDLSLPVKKIENKSGFKVSGMRFEYYGRCKFCLSKKS